ncbi:MAG: hypothetical protein EXQ77_03715 [Thermoleophilia bacterium]|nr:hypothetical protein [Thermoleophilia bacterium]
MRRVLATAATLAVCVLASVAPASAGERELWPGVTYEKGVQFTPNGPVEISILRGPRPDGLTTLEPVLSTESILGLETLTAMQRRLAPTATTAGVNGDFFTLATGRPSGVFMRNGQLVLPPQSSRVSAGISADGTLEIRKVGFYGSWQGRDVKHPLQRLNEAPKSGGAALFTEAYGFVTPPVAGATAAVLFPFPAATPDTDLPAVVSEVLDASTGVTIPPGGAVLVTLGMSVAKLLAETSQTESLTVRLGFLPDWPGIVSAIGGGPRLVEAGVPLYTPGDAFTSIQLEPRHPRTAIGQLADGRFVLVAVDGRRPAFSVGLTNFELAQTLVRLGAVTAMAFDGGGSTTMAFDGTVLNTPSGGVEREIATALVFAYQGVFVPEPVVRVSPNGDGVDDDPVLTVRVPRPSLVTVRLVGPEGLVAFEETVQRDPGVFPVAFGAVPPPTIDPATGLAAEAAAPAAAPGAWALEATAVDDLGRTTTMTRTFAVDDTLGFVAVPGEVVVGKQGARLPFTWQLFRKARMSVTVIDPKGRYVTTLVKGVLAPGSYRAVWPGLRRGKPVAPGRWTIRISAVGPVGRVESLASVVVRRAAF